MKVNKLKLGREGMGIHGDSLMATGLHSDFGNWQLHLKSKVLHHQVQILSVGMLTGLRIT